MRIIYLTIFFVLTFLPSDAHPGIGIVYDENETIYYKDLNLVWKLNIRTGKSDLFPRFQVKSS